MFCQQRTNYFGDGEPLRRCRERGHAEGQGQDTWGGKRAVLIRWCMPTLCYIPGGLGQEHQAARSLPTSLNVLFISENCCSLIS